MKRWNLRTHFLLTLAFLLVYGISAELSYRALSRSQDRLADHLERDLSILSQLPLLQGRLRQLDLITDQYLLTASPQALAERERVLAATRRSLQRLFDLTRGVPRESAIVAEIDQGFKAQLVEQNQWIARKSRGQLSLPDAAMIISRRRPFAGLIELLARIQDINLLEIERQRVDARRAAAATFLVFLLTGVAGAVLLALWVFRYLIRPLRILEAYARGWRLGEPWTVHIPPAAPEIRRLYHCMRDMAHRLAGQYEHEAELARLKTQLVSVVSHEFNNALSIIQGGISLLQETEGEAPPAKRAEYYQVVRANIRALAIESSNLLHMGRLEAGRFSVTPKRTDLAPILEDSLARLKVLYERKQQKVSLSVPHEPSPVSADPDSILMVVNNLLTNAIKYTPREGRIDVSLEREGDRVRVTFRDTGIGISQEERKKIFAGYYRTETSRRAAKGFGVGLPLVKTILEAHGTRLALESEPGKGSTFSFELPLWRDGDAA